MDDGICVLKKKNIMIMFFLFSYSFKSNDAYVPLMFFNYKSSA